MMLLLYSRAGAKRSLNVQQSSEVLRRMSLANSLESHQRTQELF